MIIAKKGFLRNRKHKETGLQEKLRRRYGEREKKKTNEQRKRHIETQRK